MAPLGIDPLHLRSETQIDILFIVESRRTQIEPFQRHLSQQVGLAERRALIGRDDFGTDQRDAAVKPLVSQACHAGGPGLAGPHYNNVLHIRVLRLV